MAHNDRPPKSVQPGARDTAGSDRAISEGEQTRIEETERANPIVEEAETEGSSKGPAALERSPSIAASPMVEDPQEYLPFGTTIEPEGKPDRPVLAPPTRESLLPIHDFVRLYPREWAVVNHPAFQRLGGIFQLGQTFLVFRGATHCRFEHALGTLHVAQLIIDSLDRNAATEDLIPKSAGGWSLDEPLTRAERRFIRLGALLHDIGHLSAGHTLEDELGLLDHHDADNRMNLILDRKEWYGVAPEETLREVIDRLYADAAAETGLDLPASEIVLHLVSRDRKDLVAPAGVRFRANVGRDIIGNTICADLVDYIYRDWGHLGKARHFDNRLIDYMELRGKEAKSELVINLRTSNDVRSDAVSAMLELLESRYQLGEIALYHRTKLCAAAMLERLIAELDELEQRAGRPEWRESLTDRLLECSDWELLALLANDANELRDHQSAASEQAEHIFRTAVNLRTRRLHKKVFQIAGYGLAGVVQSVHELYADGGSSPEDAEETNRGRLRRAAQNRLRAVRTLEADFGLAPLSVVMYCPPPKMNTKVANVKVLFNGRVRTLEQHEAEEDDKLTGGHLEAQKDRFKRLWRVQFAVERSALAFLKRTEQFELFMDAIEKLVLGRLTQGTAPDSAARSLAVLAAGREGSPLYGKELVPVGFNRGGKYQDLGYPAGGPALVQHIAEDDLD